MSCSHETLVRLYRWRGYDFAILITLFLTVGTGCATSQSQDLDSNDATTPWLEDGETIALLSSPQFLFHWEHDLRATRIDPIACARQGLVDEGVGDRVLSEEMFKQTAFPDLPPEAAPTDAESIRLLLSHPTLLRRIAPLNLRYIVYATSETEVREAFESWTGVAGAYGGAVVGWKNWKQSSEFSFLVIDAKAVKDVASAETQEDGTGWWTTGVVVVPFVFGYESPTEQVACDDMALKLRDALREYGLQSRH